MPEQFAAGDTLSGFGRDLDQARLVMYAGATWDWHRLHYDTVYATRHKLAAPLVDGQMLGALFAEQIYRNFDPRARVTSMKLGFRSMVYVGERVEIRGEVVSVDHTAGGRLVVCRQSAAVGSRTTTTCITEVLVPD